MNLQTQVKIEDNEDFFDYKSSTLSIGSCFSSEAGNKLHALGFDMDINPFGVVFNPVSIFQQIQNSIDGVIREDLILNRDERYFHYACHSDVNGQSKDELIDKIKSSQVKINDRIKYGTHLFITLGTAWAYRLKEQNTIVANCHKVPASQFTKELIDLEKLNTFSSKLFKSLFELNPKLKVLITVSPVRHKKDGLHENNISKGLLQLFSHHLLNKFKQIQYFPSYELVVDELRDYRFFKEDMVHPTEQAIDYVLDKFSSHYMSDRAVEQMKIRKQLIKAQNHDFMHASDEEKQKHQDHITTLEEKLAKFNP